MAAESRIDIGAADAISQGSRDFAVLEQLTFWQFRRMPLLVTPAVSRA
jgi:hypothetical protein